MIKKVPHIYLDTAILRTIIEKKPPQLLNLMRTIKERKWVCFTSTLGILELSDLKKDDVYLKNKVKEKLEYKEIIRNRDKKELSNVDLTFVRKYINDFLRKYPYFSAYQIPIEVWVDALAITFNSNIHSNDAIHLASALNFNASVLITIDSHFIKQANIFLKEFKLDKKLKVISSANIYDTLAEFGFKFD